MLRPFLARALAAPESKAEKEIHKPTDSISWRQTRFMPQASLASNLVQIQFEYFACANGESRKITKSHTIGRNIYLSARSIFPKVSSSTGFRAKLITLFEKSILTDVAITVSLGKRKLDTERSTDRE
jgi:hypothetical protein